MLRTAALLLLLAVISGCAPSISPLYRDFDDEQAAEAAEADQRARVRAALIEAGWTPATGAVPDVLATETRVLRRWGLYRVEVELEVVPLAGSLVRVMFHPYRRYVTGSRSKIPYLKRSLRRALLPELTEAFAAQGLVVLGTDLE